MSMTKEDYTKHGRNQFRAGMSLMGATDGRKPGTWQHLAIVDGWHAARNELNSTKTPTGRTASDTPQIQKLPMNTPEGRRVREAFRSQLRGPFQEAGKVKVSFRQLPEEADQAAKVHQLDLIAQMKAETSVPRISRLGHSLRRLAARWQRRAPYLPARPVEVACRDLAN